jgi:hypothetical protein
MALLLTGSGARALRLIEDAGFEASLPAEAPSQP